MITFEKQQYCIDLNNYAEQYIQQLRQSMLKNSTYIDANYVRTCISELQSFAALVRLDCFNDMMFLQNDLNYAKTMQDMYSDFGEYCYDMLKSAYNATNECLALCNQLYYSIIKHIESDKFDIAVASNYIGFNIFSKSNVLELCNFRRMTGFGLCYDIHLKQATIDTSNIHEQMQPTLLGITAIANVIEQLQSRTGMYNDIDAWSVQVNDKLQTAKTNAIAAFNATYNAYKDAWFQLDLTKQNASTFCTLSVLKGKVNEQLFKSGRIKRLNYGTNHMQMLNLDYLNNTNFDFK